jgi:hypothetical protein
MQLGRAATVMTAQNLWIDQRAIAREQKIHHMHISTERVIHPVTQCQLPIFFYQYWLDGNGTDHL